jgi:hypothetical protein
MINSNLINEIKPKEELLVNVSLKAKEIILQEIDLIKEYRKLRMKGAKNSYYLIELPKAFVNGNYDPTKAYAISLGINKENNHKIIIIDLDEHKPILSVNNRRVLKNE